LRVSGGTSIIGKELLHEGTVVSIEDAIRLNASGVAYSILVGADFERDTILGLTNYIDEAELPSLVPILLKPIMLKILKKSSKPVLYQLL
jgi:putative autoinducer-2 (AI-2) aldolase